MTDTSAIGPKELKAESVLFSVQITKNNWLLLYSPDAPIINERYCKLRFQATQAAMLHGFAGYFSTILYDDITLSKTYCVVCKTCCVVHVVLCCLLFWYCLDVLAIVQL